MLKMVDNPAKNSPKTVSLARPIKTEPPPGSFWSEIAGVAYVSPVCSGVPVLMYQQEAMEGCCYVPLNTNTTTIWYILGPCWGCVMLCQFQCVSLPYWVRIQVLKSDRTREPL